MAKAKPIKTDAISAQGAKPPKPPKKTRAKRMTKPEYTDSDNSQSDAQTTPSSPAPATDTVSANCANKREKKNNQPKDNMSDSQTEDSMQEDSQQPQQQPAPFPTEVLSSGEGGSKTDSEDSKQTPQTATTDSQHVTGDDLLGGAVSAVDIGVSLPDSLPLARMKDNETWKQCWERLRLEARGAGMNRREAIAYAGRTVDQVWVAPPIPEPIAEEPLAEDPVVLDLPEPEPEPEFSPIGEKVVDSPPKDDPGVSGLGDLPESWGDLPANASLQVEISWVSANRLRVRDGSGVDLAKALSPAPSYSALSWLETSILFPSKFADISVKATANQDDEKEAVRREKMAIEDIRGLLAEMLEG